MIPGDPERNARKDRLINGITLPTAVWEKLTDAAAERGVDLAELNAAE